MVKYNFKTLQPILTGEEMADTVLRKTMRRTPTVVHPNYAIGRIRSFYMRKVKYSQSLFHEKLSSIVDEFPVLEDIHPFYGDLLNVLYDKDHYKLALGQISSARRMIDNIGRDYVKLLKFADSLYRCKQLKRAALGRMATIVKKQSDSLKYLEQVRQHLSRLPSIDPRTRTLILCGYPNVGKSSFMNNITRADVEVQPYAFTTKSLFVGHTDYKYLRWQVIDTPGLLDHPLADRNTIEMQSITALAHLRASVVYVLDISTACGYSIEQQVELFHSIKPLFANKPLTIAINKVDLTSMDELNEEEKELIEGLANENVQVMPMSTLQQMGVLDVRDHACDKLLAHRVEAKLRGKNIENILSRVNVSQPESRDNKERPAAIPQSVLEKRNKSDNNDEEDEQMDKLTERQLEEQHGGPGVYQPDLKQYYDLKNPEWKYDKVPEIVNGHNIADFVDPEIENKLGELEKEEEQMLAEVEAESDESDLDETIVKTSTKLRKKKKVMRKMKALRSRNHVQLPRNKRPVDFESVARELKDRGVDGETISRARSRSRPRSEVRGRSRSKTRDAFEMERARSRSVSEARGLSESKNKSGGVFGKKRSRSKMARSRTPGRNSSIRNVRRKIHAEGLEKDATKGITRTEKVNESDRRYFESKPKHLFVGKRGNGTNDRR
eukprot:gb/GECH01011771.1/.p1 GENE.gb/GECH01011771.1/~~gb/GECH01011771.1/.p1  ORF type:complete len:666 (+),score=180.38 gb/GECH01011771.1/:1-1998(+)